MHDVILSTPVFEPGQATFTVPAISPIRDPETWHELVDAEPALADVETFCRSIRGRRDWRQWAQAKARFSSLVGWGARRPSLRSSRCYEVAYCHLLGIFETRSRRRAAR